MRRTLMILITSTGECISLIKVWETPATFGGGGSPHLPALFSHTSDLLSTEIE